MPQRRDGRQSFDPFRFDSCFVIQGTSRRESMGAQRVGRIESGD
jgi:hypothetical protein